MKCKNCGKELPKKAYYFANQLAVDNNYCCYICWKTSEEKSCIKQITEHINRMNDYTKLPDNLIFYRLGKLDLDGLKSLAEKEQIKIQDIIDENNSFTMKHKIKCRLYVEYKRRRDGN